MKIVFFTGAGISKESGIDTYRDTGGTWENEDVESVGGCSIDGSIHFIKTLEKDFNLDFFDRSILHLVSPENNHETTTLHEYSSEKYKDYTYYNNLVKTLGELRDSWLIPTHQAWLSRMI